MFIYDFSVIVYSIVVNSLGWSYFGHAILPNLTWLLVIFIISPLLVLLSILLIIGSSQYFKREPLKTPVEHLERQVYLQSTVYFL